MYMAPFLPGRTDMHEQLGFLLLYDISTVFSFDNRDPRCTMVRWCKRDGTMVKKRGHDGESAMVRWGKRDGTMVKTREDGQNPTS
jgi:hypothetical protein